MEKAVAVVKEAVKKTADFVRNHPRTSMVVVGVVVILMVMK